MCDKTDKTINDKVPFVRGRLITPYFDTMIENSSCYIAVFTLELFANSSVISDKTDVIKQTDYLNSCRIELDKNGIATNPAWIGKDKDIDDIRLNLTFSYFIN